MFKVRYSKKMKEILEKRKVLSREDTIIDSLKNLKPKKIRSKKLSCKDFRKIELSKKIFLKKNVGILVINPEGYAFQKDIFGYLKEHGMKIKFAKSFVYDKEQIGKIYSKEIKRYPDFIIKNSILAEGVSKILVLTGENVVDRLNIIKGSNYGFSSSTLRGKLAAKNKWLLSSIAKNLLKYKNPKKDLSLYLSSVHVPSNSLQTINHSAVLFSKKDLYEILGKIK